jgi:hypothetical protein
MTDRPTRPEPPGNGEIEVTPDMVGAGINAFCAPDSEYENDAETVVRIYRAMQRASVTTWCEGLLRPSPQPSSES